MGEYLPALRLKSLSAFLFYEGAKMKRISVAHRFKDMALVTAVVRGIAFSLITLLFTTVAFFKGFLWCIYLGFSLTMAFGAKKGEYKNYVCSLLAGYVWSLAYVFFPSFMEKTFHIPSFTAMTVSELILTFLLLFVHLKFLRNTWLNKIPMVFAGITTVFIGGIDHIALCGLSTFMGISMAVLTEIIIVFLAATNKEKQVKQ